MNRKVLYQVFFSKFVNYTSTIIDLEQLFVHKSTRRKFKKKIQTLNFFSNTREFEYFDEHK